MSTRWNAFERSITSDGVLPIITFPQGYELGVSLFDLKTAVTAASNRLWSDSKDLGFKWISKLLVNSRFLLSPMSKRYCWTLLLKPVNLGPVSLKLRTIGIFGFSVVRHRRNEQYRIYNHDHNYVKCSTGYTFELLWLIYILS